MRLRSPIRLLNSAMSHWHFSTEASGLLPMPCTYMTVFAALGRRVVNSELVDAECDSGLGGTGPGRGAFLPPTRRPRRWPSFARASCNLRLWSACHFYYYPSLTCHLSLLNWQLMPRCAVPQRHLSQAIHSIQRGNRGLCRIQLNLRCLL